MAEINNMKITAEKDIKIIVSRMLREDKIFMVFGLELLDYNIILTETSINHPFLQNISAFAIPELNSIFINIKGEFFQTKNKIIDPDTFRNKITFILLHEACHILWYHSDRLKHRDPFLWNAACDYMINLLLYNLEQELIQCSPEGSKNEKLISMDVQSYAKEMLFDKKYENQIEEEIYRDLEKKGNYKKKTYKISLSDLIGDNSKSKKNGNQPNSDDKSNKDNNQNKNKGPQVEVTEVEYNFNGKIFKTAEIKMPPGSISKEQKQKIKDRIDANKTLLVDKLMKGDVSSKMKTFLRKLFEVKIDWTKILKDSLATELEKKTELTWSTPRPAYLANPTVLPYLPNIDTEETFGTVIFAIDESGSMGDNDVRAAISIVNQSKQYYKQIYLMKHDYDVGWEILIDEMDDATIKTLLKRRHCGGTSHKDVFKKIVKFIKKNPDERISCFIGCTDLYSDIEDTQNIMPIFIPRIWIVNNSTASTDRINGRIIRINT